MSLLALAFLLAPPVDWRPQPTQRPDGAIVVPLSVTRCLMKEVEVDPLLYTAKSAAACARINRATEKTRTRRRLRLSAGRYAFRVSNLDVPWLVDFALRGAHEKGLPHTSGGKMKPGDILDYVVDLKPGVYVFASPLGGTPEYRLLVESRVPTRR
jgi:hypothetical protein